MSASIQGSSVHSVRARVTVSSGGPSYPDARARVSPDAPAAARAVVMPVTLPRSPSAGFSQVRCLEDPQGAPATQDQEFAQTVSRGYVNRYVARKTNLAGSGFRTEANPRD